MAHGKSHRYRVVDVFSRVPLAGNALAVFPESPGLDPDTMQSIARELNLSETVFIQPAQHPGCVAALRIFTPSRELPFAGHPTIGAAFVLLTEHVVPGTAGQFTIEEKVGPVQIRVEEGDRPLIWLVTPPITFARVYQPSACAEALGLDQRDLLPAPPQIVTAGNPTLFVALRTREAVDRCRLDAAGSARLHDGAADPFCVFVFTPTETGAYSRMFAPEYGIVEDPATGSSTGPLAAFMHRHQLLPATADGRLVSEQGTKMGRRSMLCFDVSAIDTGAGIPVGGYVTPLVEAVLTLDT